MKTGLIVAGAVTLAALLVAGGLVAGWAIAGQRVWTPWSGGMARSGGWGMMERWGGTGGTCLSGVQGCPAGRAWGYGSSTRNETLTIEDAHEAIEQYLKDQRYGDLEIAELMEFERNFYAIVREADTGVGAMELLVDRSTGAVGPEPGPNMMWNARYGMHGRGMRRSNSETNAVSPEEAVAIAQDWLDKDGRGATAEDHADAFYGYYTIHTLRDGEIDGMLSVQGTTGEVWYHTWHGSFVQMVEMDGEETHS
jgi:hypothetical protein